MDVFFQFCFLANGQLTRKKKVGIRFSSTNSELSDSRFGTPSLEAISQMHVGRAF
jgi:hypothetical protein